MKLKKWCVLDASKEALAWMRERLPLTWLILIVPVLLYLAGHVSETGFSAMLQTITGLQG